MRVLRLSDVDLGRLKTEWDRLASDVPFRTWTWLTTWWTHYGPGLGPSAELFTLGVFDDAGRLIGVTPWYLDRCAVSGRVLRPLTLDDAYADQLSVLCAAGFEDRVLDALAEWLIPSDESDGAEEPVGYQPSFPLEESDAELDDDEDFDPWSSNYWSNDAAAVHHKSREWDAIELSDISNDGAAAARLAERLGERGASCDSQRRIRSWTVELPETTDRFIASLNVQRRNHLQRLSARWLDSGRATLHLVQCESELSRGYEILTRLRQGDDAGGRPTCAACGKAADSLEPFDRDVTQRLLVEGHLRLAWIECDGRPVCAQYMLAAGSTIYLYRSICDDQSRHLAPHHLGMFLVVRWAIEQGYRAIQLPRGDGNDRVFWGAQPRPRVDLRIAAPCETVHSGHALRGRYGDRRAQPDTRFAEL